MKAQGRWRACENVTYPREVTLRLPYGGGALSCMEHARLGNSDMWRSGRHEMTMYYCPITGEPLTDFQLPGKYWCRLLYSSREAYLVVSDNKWGDSPLLPLQLGVFEKLREAPEELLDLAFQRILRIDYRTVSITGFGHTLLGCFDPKRMYRIVYGGGSESASV